MWRILGSRLGLPKQRYGLLPRYFGAPASSSSQHLCIRRANAVAASNERVPVRQATTILLFALICAPGLTAQIGWQFTFDSGDFGGGKYSPAITDGVAHYVLEHGYIANVQQEFSALPVAEHPFFGIRARDVRGSIFVKFRIDGEWQKSWVIPGWGPMELATKYVDLRQLGEEVSGVWLNSQSSTDGAEWFLDWLGFVKSDNPLNVRIVTAGGLVGLPEERALNLNLRNDLDADARLMCTVKGLPPDEEFQSWQPVDAAAGQAHNVGMRVPADSGARYELSIEDRDTKVAHYRELLTVPPVVEAHMVAPSYRNAIYATQTVDQIRADCKLNILPPLVRDLRLRTRLMQGDRAIYGTETASQEFEARVEAPAADIAPGEYSLAIEAWHGEQLLGRQRLPLTVHGPHPNEVWVGEDLTIRVNGEPFLPVGFYSVPQEHLAQVAEAGFTAVLTYDSDTQQLAEYLDEAERVGLKAVVHSAGLWFGKDGQGKLREAGAALRDKPALLGWYLVDEPSTGREGTTPEDLKRLYAFMQEQDPYHPTFTVYCVPGEFELYRDTHDVFMCDPYPVGHAPLTYVAQWTELGKRAMAGRKPVVIVPQSFGSEEGPQTQWRMPTAKEERCMGYLALVHGARGLFYYRFDVQEHVPELAAAGKWPWRRIGYMPELRADTWAGFERLGPELGRLAPVMLSPEPEMAVAVSPEQPELHTALREHEGKLYLIAVNPHDEALEATVRIEGLKTQRARRVLGDAGFELEDGALRHRFEPHAVQIYTLE